MTAGTSGATAQRRPRTSRRYFMQRDWHWGIVTAAIAAVASIIPRLFNPTFYYWDDMMQSFLPLWRHMGEEIRSGRFPLMEPGGWVGGNIVAEVGYGIFNPVNIVNSVIVSNFENLSLASYFIIIQFIALLAFGTYMLARDYGSNRPLALAAGVAIPFSGFTLFYEAARWPGGLMAFAWITVFWWSVRRYARRNTSPFLPFLLGFLTMTAGNPYGAIGVILVLGAVAVELMLMRHWRRLIPIVIVGALVGLTAVLVYFPLPLSSAVTVRQQNEILNDLFLSPDMSSLLTMSTSSMTPRINNFWAPIDNVPSSYLAWFVLPLLPWLDFRSFRGRSRQIFSIYVITGIYFLLTFAPSQVLVFRWPIRLIEYVYLGVIVLVAVVASAGLKTTAWKKRLFITVAILAFGTYRAWSMVPGGGKWQIFTLAVTLGLVCLAIFGWRRFGYKGLAAVLVIGTIATLGMQSRQFVPNNAVAGIGSPVDAETLRDATSDYKGNTIQIFNTMKITGKEFTGGQLLYGNQILNADVNNSMGRYSGISFTTYVNALCMNYRGETCPLAYTELFKPASDKIDATLADVLQVETVAVQKTLIAPDQLKVAPGWSIVSSDDSRTILRRDKPLPYPGTVSWASEGVSVQDSVRNGTDEKVTLSGSGSAGQLTLARLAWPGYSVKVDGQPQTLTQGPAGVILVDVPAGAKSVDITFTTPGLTIGLAAQALAWFGILLFTVIHYVRRRRNTTAAETTAPKTAQKVTV
ncbi:hypothetical protein NEK97_07510 [Paenarthrobacter sp. UW852]|uniref:hypothetical protein n=1 Tax=Paenarthrobacter sp. UW852 TaxID=2951989 RepID=UPI002148668D|nr:hypothetical protein [Paenarthrobacter sp. UW852]MCR1161300.1 hypothetical protein [Paenarthrobacter sp. UW852]